MGSPAQGEAGELESIQRRAGVLVRAGAGRGGAAGAGLLQGRAGWGDAGAAAGTSLLTGGRGQSQLLPAAGQQGAAAPDWGLGVWALGECLGHPSSSPGTAAAQPYAELCPGDPHPRSSPAVPGRASPRWLAPLHNPAAVRCLHTTIGTIFIPFLVVTGSTKVLGVEALLPCAVV